MNYTLHQLRIFLEVVERGSITAAAEALHLTQPAVSVQLKNLQQQFQLPLYEVVQRRIQITDFGKEIAALAREMLSMSEQIAQKQALYMGLIEGNLRLSAVHTGQYIVPFLIRGFNRCYPRVQIKLWIKDKEQVVKDLSQNCIDFALLTLPPSSMQLNSLPFMPNYLVPVIGQQSRWQKLGFEDIVRQAPALLREEGSGTRQMTDAYLKKKSIAIKHFTDFNSSDAIKQAIIADMGWAILPLVSLRNELLLGQIQLIETPDFPLRTEWQFVWHKEKRLLPVAQAFLRYVESIQNQFFDEHFAWMRPFLKG